MRRYASYLAAHARRASGLTRPDVARTLNVSLSTATNYELIGRVELPRHVERFAEIVGVDVEDLFDDADRVWRITALRAAGYDRGGHVRDRRAAIDCETLVLDAIAEYEARRDAKRPLPDRDVKGAA